MTILAILAVITPIIIAVAFYFLPRQLKPPKVGNFSFIGQLAYQIIGVDLEDDSPPFRGGYGFPTTGNKLFRRGLHTQAAIFHFDLTNISYETMRVTKVWIEVTRYSKGSIYVGRGEMIAGGNKMKFEVELLGTLGKHECKWADNNYDYITIPPNNIEVFEIYVRSKDAGLFEMHPIIEYSQRGRKRELKLQASEYPIMFFDDAPPPYAQQVEAIDVRDAAPPRDC